MSRENKSKRAKEIEPDMKSELESQIKRGEESRRKILPVFYSYLEKREKNFSEISEGDIKESLRMIKRAVFRDFETFKKTAIKNLTENGIHVVEAKNSKEAAEAIKKIVGTDQKIVKSKSNTFNEISPELFVALNGKLITETDLGDFLVQICNSEEIHPVLPALDLTPEEICKTILEKFGKVVLPDAASIASFARGYLREKIFESQVGLTGANAISSDGSIVILENEGNISLVSRVPEKHIVVAGIEKILPTRANALFISKCAAIFGTGQNYPSYISLISGPSKTADIQNKLVVGAQGAKEVHLILLDNGRSEILKSDYREILYCINCGSCLNFCPAYHQVWNKFGSKYFGAKGLIFARFQEGLKKAYDSGAFYCTDCGSCKENCPAGINLPEMVRLLKEELVKAGLEPEGSKKTIENLRKYGDAVGETKEAVSSKDWQCC